MSNLEASKKVVALIRPITGRVQSGDAPALLSEEALLRLEEGLRAQREQRVGRRFCEPDARGQRADMPVMASIEPFLAKRVKLSVNKSESEAAKPSDRKFLGFSFNWRKGAATAQCAARSVRFQAKSRELTRRTRGRRIEQIVKELSVYPIGWPGYLDFSQTLSVLHPLDNWLRRRLRAIAWKRWTRGPTSSRAKIRTEEPISSPFGRRQKLGLLLCALLLIVAVSALGVSLKARTGESAVAASVNTLTRGRTASMPPKHVEPGHSAATPPLALRQLFVIAREAIDFPPTSLPRSTP